MLLKELAYGGVGTAGEVAVERTIPQEGFAKHLRNREGEGDVRDLRKDFFHHTFRPEESALLGAGGAKKAGLTGVGEGAELHPLWTG